MAPVERVWAALVDQRAPQHFYFDSLLAGDLVPGGRIRYTSRDGRAVFIEGEVLEIAPPNRLVHTFRFADVNEPASRVTLTVRALGDGSETTEVKVVHDRLDDSPRTFRIISGGWVRILGNLRALLERGALPWRMRLQYFLMKVMLRLRPRPHRP